MMVETMMMTLMRLLLAFKHVFICLQLYGKEDKLVIHQGNQTARSLYPTQSHSWAQVLRMSEKRMMVESLSWLPNIAFKLLKTELHN
jgi:hypothetical protein